MANRNSKIIKPEVDEMIPVDYLQTNKERNLAEAAQLATQGREDDAILARIRANVFDIFLQTCDLKSGDKTAVVFDHLKEKWAADITLAQAHGDMAAVAVAQIKLAVLIEIEAEVTRNG